MRAARVIKKIFYSGRLPNAENLAKYQQACTRGIERELGRALRIAGLLSRCPENILENFFWHEKPFEKFLEIATGKSSYLNFSGWLTRWLPRQLLQQVFRIF